MRIAERSFIETPTTFDCGESRILNASFACDADVVKADCAKRRPPVRIALMDLNHRFEAKRREDLTVETVIREAGVVRALILFVVEPAEHCPAQFGSVRQGR